jgi:hypothetical protein
MYKAGMEYHMNNSPQQWIPNPHYTQPKKELKVKEQQQQQKPLMLTAQQNRKR